MIDGGGRDGDYNLYDHPGGYKRIMYSKMVGQPALIVAPRSKKLRI